MPHPSSLPSRFLQRFKYTICAAEEVEGLDLGSFQYNHFFQVLVGDECTPSYTNRGNVADGLGDGWLDEENKRVNGILARQYDSDQCNAKCKYIYDKNDPNPNHSIVQKVKFITIGNPPVEFPTDYDKSNLITLDMSGLNPGTDIVNLDASKTHDSNWLLLTDVSTQTENTATCASLPDPAGLAYTDLESFAPHRSKL